MGVYSTFPPPTVSRVSSVNQNMAFVSIRQFYTTARTRELNPPFNSLGSSVPRPHPHPSPPSSLPETGWYCVGSMRVPRHQQLGLRTTKSKPGIPQQNSHLHKPKYGVRQHSPVFTTAWARKLNNSPPFDSLKCSVRPLKPIPSIRTMFVFVWQTPP